MSTIKRLCLFALLNLLMPAAMAAATGPVGIWSLQVQSISLVKFPGKASKITPVSSNLQDFQFKEDGRYDALPPGAVTGRWKASGNGKKYRVEYDFNAVDLTKAQPVFVQAMLSHYASLAAGEYAGSSSPGAAPAIQKIQILSYKDKGRVLSRTFRVSGQPKRRRGEVIAGSASINARVYFQDPATKKDVSARVKTNFGYGGTRFSAPSSCCSGDDAAANLAESGAFLVANGKLPNVEATGSGLQYRILNSGEGKRPLPASTVTVNYRAILPSGDYLFSQSAAKWRVASLLKGLSEGIQLMPEGAWYRLYLPPELAFGEAGSAPSIKPNAALIFDVQLTKIE
jgi:FKBP-type peptidyl-prolyl cis-trans isomerase